MSKRGSTVSLERALRLFGGLVVPAGGVWAAIGFSLPHAAVAALGLIAIGFGLALLYESWNRAGRQERKVALRAAMATQATALAIVLVTPGVGTAMAFGVLIPVLVALPYVRRPVLARLMVVSAAIGSFALFAPVILPWSTNLGDSVALVLPASALVVVFALFQIFLWNASARVSDTTAELRHVIEMAHDLAATLDPKDVGNRLARHIAQVARADFCVLSTWDRSADRVVTFGSWPADHAPSLEPAYDLTAYPATRGCLVSHEPCVIYRDDPDADPAEIAYLDAIGHRSLAMLPLVVRGESIGIVELTSESPHAFTERDVVLAQLLVREAATTFDNARLTDALRQQAFLDPLTGLANRARLQDRLEHALSRLRGRSPNRVAVIFVDLDHFKHLNDRFGHAKGDRALRVIADRIRSIVRPGDTAGRLGGDEFAVVLEDVESADVARVVCERLLEGLSQPVELDDTVPIVGASIGYALSEPTSTGEDLLRNADIAMYAAKAAGRGQIVAFRPELLATASARSELAALLRGAESRRELHLHFQPIVDLEDGAPIGLEALVRWQPKGHVLLLPSDFLDLAEETGEILAIGRWVLAEACRTVRAWQTRYGVPNLRLYVNVSARQFRDPGLIPTISAALARSGLAPGDLALEITEGTLLTPGPETIERIGELRSLGVRLAIDDFGTGYSSLGYLHAFQIDELKIDQSFVPNGQGVSDAHVLSQAIVELGRALSLDMIAEGLETPDQADWFRTLGCRFGQGFLYAQPMPTVDTDRYLRRALGRPVRRSRGPRATLAPGVGRSTGRVAG